MERHAALVRVVEIERDAPLKLTELAVRAGIADGVDGEDDMRSRGIDPPIGGRHSGRGDLCKDTERQDNADEANALDKLVVAGHEAPHLRHNEHSRRAAYSFPFVDFTHSLRSPTFISSAWGFASGGGFQICFSSVCAHAATCSTGLRPTTRKPRPPRDQLARESCSRFSVRIGASAPPLANTQNTTGAPEGST